MNKKSLIRTIVLALGLTSAASFGGSMISAKTSADFSDLEDLDAATKAKFDALFSAGIFDGISDGSFGLKEEMNRAQFAKVAALIFGLKVDMDLKKSSFTDVEIDTPDFGYALPYIEAMKSAGITAGYGEGTFNPAGMVTNEQLATFLVKGLGKGEEAKTAPAPAVDDPTVSNWAKGYVEMALRLNLLGNRAGGTGGTFGGNTPADRGQLATGAFESAKKVEELSLVHPAGARFETGDILHLKFTGMIDPKSIDLSKIKINGVALDPKLDSFELSEDKKSIIIRLHKALPFNPDKMPLIDITDHLSTLFGNSVKNDGDKPIPVTVDRSLVTKPKTTTPPTSSPIPDTDSNTDTNTDTDTDPNPSPSPSPSPDNPNSPNQ